MKESELLSHVIEIALRRNAFVARINSGSGHGHVAFNRWFNDLDMRWETSGFADLEIYYNGILLFVETKIQLSRKTQEMQQKFADTVRLHGASYIRVTSIEEFNAFWEQIIYG